jgi:hypothetical protein
LFHVDQRLTAKFALKMFNKLAPDSKLGLISWHFLPPGGTADPEYVSQLLFS